VENPVISHLENDLYASAAPGWERPARVQRVGGFKILVEYLFKKNIKKNNLQYILKISKV